MRDNEVDSFFSYNDGHYVHYSAETEDGRGYEYRMVCSRIERRRVTDKEWSFIADQDWPCMTPEELRQIANLLTFARAGAHHPKASIAARHAEVK